MKKLLLLVCFAPVFVMLSCAPNCNTVTGPNDVPYTIVNDLPCFSCGSGTYGEHLINSATDFDALCPGGTVPVSWDFVNKTYIIICACDTAHEPYLAGVGTDPLDANQILATIGLPCSRGMEIQMIVYKTFTLETAKTAKTLKVVEKDE